MRTIKQTVSLSISCIIIMLFGLVLLYTQTEYLLMVLGGMCIACGFLPLSYLLVEQSCSLKVYRFTHYYEHGNTLHNETTDLYKLSNSDVTQLKNYSEDILIDVFAHNPILIEKSTPCGLDLEGQTKVVGWVKATNIEEAQHILHYNAWSYTPDNLELDWDM